MKPTKPGFYWFLETPAIVWHDNGDKLMFHTLHDPTVCEVGHTDAYDWGQEIKIEERCSHEETQRDYKMFADAAAELESSRELRRRLEKILQEKNDND